MGDETEAKQDDQKEDLSAEGTPKGTPICFHASIPSLASAFNFHGEEGARFKLDVPESDLQAIQRLVREGKNKLLKVTVEVEDDAENYWAGE